MPAHEPSAVRLLLVRHGAVPEAEGRCLGRCDVPLSRAGAAAIRAIGASWPHEEPTRIVASDLLRAARSARILARRWALPVVLEPRLREMDFGQWDGRLWEEIRASDGSRLDEWFATWRERAAPGGESFPDVRRRVAQWARELRPAAHPGDVVLAVAHAGSIRALLCELQGSSPAGAFAVPLQNGAVVRMELAASRH